MFYNKFDQQKSFLLKNKYFITYLVIIVTNTKFYKYAIYVMQSTLI